MSTLNCPHCSQIDQVQKVSALFSQGTSYTTFNAPAAAARFDDTTIIVSKEQTAISRSALSEDLKPPAIPKPIEPKIEDYSNKRSNLYIFLAIVCFIAGLVPVVSQIMIMSFDGVDSERIVFICFGLFFWFVTAVFLRMGWNVKKNGKNIYEAQMSDYIQKKIKYDHVWYKWQSAYYCGRCDVVFVPGSTQYRSVNQMHKFLEE